MRAGRTALHNKYLWISVREKLSNSRLSSTLDFRAPDLNEACCVHSGVVQLMSHLYNLFLRWERGIFSPSPNAKFQAVFKSEGSREIVYKRNKVKVLIGTTVLACP